MKVFKFGGASLRDAENIRNVAGLLQNYRQEIRSWWWYRPWVKPPTHWKRLQQPSARQNGKAADLYREVKERHYAVMRELFDENDEVFTLVNGLLSWRASRYWTKSLLKITDYVYDTRIVCLGELVSSRIMAAYLNKSGLPTTWLDARDVIYHRQHLSRRLGGLG
jgi:aspartate kinase